MKSNLFKEMRRMQQEIDDIFERYFKDSRNSFPLISNNKNNLEEFREPETDFIEDENKIKANIEIPGVDKKDISLNIENDFLEIKAEKNIEDKQKETYKKSYQGFYTSYKLPENIDKDNISAEYQNGILKLKIPKKQIEQKEKKKIEVK